jgi:hypothetical protein
MARAGLPEESGVPDGVPVGAALGHSPILGAGRVIRTSGIRIMSEACRCARGCRAGSVAADLMRRLTRNRPWVS